MSITKLTETTCTEFLEANHNALVVLVYDAEFTGQQDIVQESIKALSSSALLSSRIVIGYVDVESNNELARLHSVTTVPMIVCIKKNRVVKKIDVLEPEKLVNMVNEQLVKLDLMSTDESNQNVDQEANFKTYLKGLTTRAPVMIFMKGDPKVPRCGFSKQLVAILTKYDIKYESFDILQDDEVREGLKKYSDWPTYPQIYVKGEFVGGLDILKQLEETGELETTLKV